MNPGFGLGQLSLAIHPGSK